MDINRSISFIFNDQEWLKKLAIAGLVALIPIVGIFVLMGWGLEITRKVVKGEAETLPNIEFGEMMGSGFKLFVVQILYSLPVLLLLGCGLSIMLATSMGAATNEEMLNQIMAGSGAVVYLCTICLVIPLSIFVGLCGKAAYGILADTGEIGAALKFGTVFGIVKKGLGKYIIALLVVALASSILSPIGTLLCGVGALFTSAFIIAFDAHLTGQIYHFAKPDSSISAPGTVEIL